MAFLIGAANSAADTAYNVANSCRLDGSSAYMHKTPGSEGNKRTWTFSTWYKKGSKAVAGNDGRWIAVGADDDNRDFIYHGSTNMIGYMSRRSGSAEFDVYTVNNVHRDTSAWYHLVVAVDTTQGTAANRVKLYLNNVQLTSDNVLSGSTSYPDQNYDTSFNDDVKHWLARDVPDESYFDGYMAETILVDGSQLTPSSFGEYDEDSPTIWKPIDVSGLTFGTNGFYLDFEASGNLGNDANGGTDLTEVNLAAADQATDTPTNNFCTLNPLYKDAGNNIVAAAFSEGNTKMLTTVNGWKFGRGTFLLTSGKWYAEVKATEAGTGGDGNFGIVPSQGGIVLGETDDNAVFEGCRVGLGSSDTNLQKLDTGSATTIFDDFASGNIAHLAIDLDNNKIWVGNDGTWYNDNNASTTFDASNHDIALPTVTEGWLFGVGQSKNDANNITWEYNWGNPPHTISSGNADANGYGNFEFAVPTGFYSVCTKNLAEFG